MPILEKQMTTTVEQEVSIDVAGAQLRGDLIVPEQAFGLVLFADPCSRNRNGWDDRRIASEFEEQGLATLLFDLFISDEEEVRGGQEHTEALADRWLAVADWAGRQPDLAAFPLAFCGFGAAALAALVAAARQPQSLGAVVCRDGRVDLMGGRLASVKAPTLLVVGAAESRLARAHEAALLRLGSPRKELVILPNVPVDEDRIDSIADLVGDWLGAQLIQLA